MSLDVYLKENITDASFNIDEVEYLAINFAIVSLQNSFLDFNSWFSHISPLWREIANRNNPEWKYPNKTVYWANITHNLGKMANEAGIYKALWRPFQLREGYNIPEQDYDAQYKFEAENPVIAGEIIPLLEKGLADLKARPEHYKKFNSPNGWGMYEHFVPFVEEYLKACKEHPEATIEVSR